MISRLINILSVRISRFKKFDIDLNDFFPLEVHDFKEYSGSYTSKQENFPFICLCENMNGLSFEGKNTILQNRSFINDSGSILFSDEIVFGDTGEKIYEYSRYRNGVETIHPVPMVYLDKYEKVISPNNVFIFKSFKPITVNGVESFCWVITKFFYTRWRLQRIERLYLLEGVGMIKYEEESFYPYKFQLSYKISDENSGYRIIKHESLGNLLYNPISECFSGKFQIVSDHWVDIFIATEDEVIGEEVQKSEEILNDFVKMEYSFKQQIAQELLVLHNDRRSEGEVTISKEFAERIRLTSISFLSDGSIEAYYNDGDLFCRRTILAILNEKIKLKNVDVIG